MEKIFRVCLLLLLLPIFLSHLLPVITQKAIQIYLRKSEPLLLLNWRTHKIRIMNLLTDNIPRTEGQILFDVMDILKLGKGDDSCQGKIFPKIL